MIFQSRTNNAAGWRSMSDAPRDGSIIEVRCTYGVAPWYGLFQWIVPSYGGKAEWCKVGCEASGFTESDEFSWRPYASSGKYVDPTGGAQDSPEYWLRACGLRR